MEQLDFLEAIPDEARTEQAQVDMINVAEHWYQRGWVGALDLSLLRFMDRECPGQPAAVLLACVLTTYQLNRGHICLDLEAVLANPDWYLSLPPEEDRAEPYTDLPSILLSSMTLSDWLELLSDSPLISLPEGEESSPLVLDSGSVYLRRQWRYEVEAAQRILSIAADRQPDWPELKQDLDALFGPVAADTEIDWQRVACALSTRHRLTLITGGPGTGKTTTVVRILALLQHQALRASPGMPLDIALAAPTGKAAARLSDSIGGAISQLPEAYQQAIPSDVSTLHRLLGVIPGRGANRYNASHPLSADLVVVDEASMIDLELFHGLLSALKPSARLVLLGDKDQLASVEAGAVLGELCSEVSLGGYSQDTLGWLGSQGLDLTDWIDKQGRTGDQLIHQCSVMLHRSYRFSAESGIGQLARAVNLGDAAQVEQILISADSGLTRARLTASIEAELKLLICVSDAPRQGYKPYLNWLSQKRLSFAQLSDPDIENWANELLNRFNLFRILTPLRRGKRGVEGLNLSCEKVLAAQRLITSQRGDWYPGRPVMLLENDYGLGLMNGDTGICVAVEDQARGMQLRVLFKAADRTLKWVSPSRLERVETAFAMTVHKSQGSEFAHTALVMPERSNPILTRELIYTAITRAKSEFTLLDSHPEALKQSVETQISRASGLYRRVTTGAE